MELQIITRKQAKEQGLTHYYTGHPCKYNHVSKRRTSSGNCCICERITSKNWVTNNQLKRRKIMSNYNINNKDKLRDKYYQRVYGISLSEYNFMLEKQNNVCLLCCKPDSGGKELAVDHCHKTGLVRGLLCNKCNRAIGFLEEDITLLYKTISYLTKKPETQ